MPYKDPAKRKACHAKWVAENAERNCEHKRRWRDCNRDKYRASGRITSQKWRAAHPIEAAAKRRRSMKKLRENRMSKVANGTASDRDINWLIANKLRVRFLAAFAAGSKAGSAVRMLGCTIAEFRCQMESQWSEGMSWKNYGRGGWHIDHIKPISWFDLTDAKQQALACHHTNLHPAWESDNCSKGARWDGKAA
jgi:hypothetical protein